ncbi:hypothetical protein LCGC14_0488660 [marine sediment metagenome]|uniref:Uncharacterized protein n=1 Tax=marine sediment metagenome TaxID=412755 RepID=A0A0F9SCI3_9ZZZZ
MIATIIIIGLAFIWLGYETNWMRVRLPIGASTPIIKQQYTSWNDLENLAQTIPDKQKPFWLKHPLFIKTIRGINNQMLGASMEPLCGWDWLRNRMHIIPQYQIVLVAEHSKITINSQSIPHLRDAFRVNRNPYLRVKL